MPKVTGQMSKEWNRALWSWGLSMLPSLMSPLYCSCSKTSVSNHDSHSLNLGNNECQGVRASGEGPQWWAAREQKVSYYLFISVTVYTPTRRHARAQGKEGLSLEKSCPWEGWAQSPSNCAGGKQRDSLLREGLIQRTHPIKSKAV